MKKSKPLKKLRPGQLFLFEKRPRVFANSGYIQQRRFPPERFSIVSTDSLVCISVLLIRIRPHAVFDLGSAQSFKEWVENRKHQRSIRKHKLHAKEIYAQCIFLQICSVFKTSISTTNMKTRQAINEANMIYIRNSNMIQPQKNY